MGEVPLYDGARETCSIVQGYLAHKKTPIPLGPPQDPRHRLVRIPVLNGGEGVDARGVGGGLRPGGDRPASAHMPTGVPHS
jgi:hypothetical protein